MSSPLPTDASTYLIRVINKHKSTGVHFFDPRLTEVKNVIRRWAGDQLASLDLSGSVKKGTAIKGRSDCDLFISLKANTKNTLGEIYDSLFNALAAAGFQPRRQNVSIGIRKNGLDIDLVPAKRHPGYLNRHSLHVRNGGTWTQTNVQTHINQVKNSGRTREIILTKIWCKRHGLKFPSIVLELAVIRALHGKWTYNTAANFKTVLEYLSNQFATARLVDPSNTNNVVSQSLSAAEKRAIVNQARVSLRNSNWNKVVW